MDTNANPVINLENLDEWLASIQPETTAQHEAELPTWMQDVFQDPHNEAAGPASHYHSAPPESPTEGKEPSDALERIRRKNRLAQQRSRKRRNDQLKELEDQVRQLRELLALERQRSRVQPPSSVERQSSQATEDHHFDASSDGNGRGLSPTSSVVAKQVQGSASTMAALLASLADGSWDDRFFPLLGRHFGNSAARHRLNHDEGPISVFQDPEVAAMSWRIMFTADSDNFARAANARQVSVPSVIVMPELVLYKVCRFYFRLLLPFSTSYGSGMVNLNGAKLLKEPEMIFDDARQQPHSTLGKDGYLPEVVMPTRIQKTIGAHPIEVAIIPFGTVRDKVLLTVMAMNGRPGFEHNTPNNTVTPDNANIYDFTIGEKPNSGKPFSTARLTQQTEKDMTSPKDPLCPAARKWLDTFMVDFVASLRVWNAGDDCFNTTSFELRPEFVAKYRLMLDADIVKTSNFWRRSRGEPRLSI